MPTCPLRRHPVPECRRSIPPRPGGLAALFALLLLPLVGGPARAQTAVWTGAGSDGNWNNSLNWSGSTAPAAAFLEFGSTPSGRLETRSSVTLNNDVATTHTYYGDVTFLAGAPAYTLTGNVISIDAYGTTQSITNLSTATQTLNLPVALQRSATVHTAAGNLVLGGVISGTNNLTKTGAFTLTLSGANTYTGVTTISAGTLSVATIGNGGVAGHLGAASSAATNLVIGNATLQYTGVSAATNRAFTITAGQTATFDITTSDLTISGAVANTSGALTKTGAGTLTLTGNNRFSGATTVREGTLVAGAANALRSTSAITVNQGGTLLLAGAGSPDRVNNSAGLTLAGGTLSGVGLSTATETLGALTLTADSTLDFGSGTGVQFTFSGVGNRSTGAELTVLGWSGTANTLGTTASDRLIFSGNASTFTSKYAQSDVSFAGFGRGYQTIQFGNQFEVVAVPVPEPATIFGGLALLGLVAWRERRRLSPQRWRS